MKVRIIDTETTTEKNRSHAQQQQKHTTLVGIALKPLCASRRTEWAQPFD